MQSDAKSENFRIQYIIEWNYVNSCTSADNHEAFPSTFHLDHEDDNDDDLSLYLYNGNHNHNHDNDDDNHDYDHLQARAKTGRRLALRASDSSPPGR